MTGRTKGQRSHKNFSVTRRVQPREGRSAHEQINIHFSYQHKVITFKVKIRKLVRTGSVLFIYQQFLTPQLFGVGNLSDHHLYERSQVNFPQVCTLRRLDGRKYTLPCELTWHFDKSSFTPSGHVINSCPHICFCTSSYRAFPCQIQTQYLQLSKHTPIMFFF